MPNRRRTKKVALGLGEATMNGRRKRFSKGAMGGAGLRTFRGIAREWNLTVAEQLALLGVSAASYDALRAVAQATRDVALSEDLLLRLSYILGIYHDLHVLLPGSANDWIRHSNSNSRFGGRTGLEIMMSGIEGMDVVRSHLAAWSRGIN